MYYVSTKGGGRGSAKCLLLLTWGEGGLRGHAYVIIFWKKMLNNLHKFFQGKRKSLESIYLLYGMFNRIPLEFYCAVVC